MHVLWLAAYKQGSKKIALTLVFLYLIILCSCTGCEAFSHFIRIKYYMLYAAVKLVELAAWLESWFSHLRVAGSSPGHDNL